LLRVTVTFGDTVECAIDFIEVWAFEGMRVFPHSMGTHLILSVDPEKQGPFRLAEWPLR
jgi:hypothetical protein